MIPYEVLKQRRDAEQPYRGFTNRYPILSRRTSKKFFLDEGGVFRLYNNHNWLYECVSAEVYEAEKARVSASTRGDFSEFKVPSSPLGHVSWGRHADHHFRIDKSAHEFCLVHPDSSVEFTATHSIYQGDAELFRCLTGRRYSMFRRKGSGGVVIVNKDGKRPRRTPVFKGLKLDANGVSHQNIEAFRIKVDTKSGRNDRIELNRNLRAVEIWTENIPRNALLDIAKSDGHMNQRTWPGSETFPAVMDVVLDKLKSNDPVGAFAWFAASRTALDYPDPVSATHYVRSEFRNLVLKYEYKRHPEWFKHEQIDFHAGFPATKWGYVIKLDGQTVKQY